MTRGRKKDMTIPTTRALFQQRAYRDRRAKHIADLEERCRKADEENIRLRAELEMARVGATAPSPNIQPHNVSEITQVSSELLQQLLSVSSSIVRYQQIVLGDIKHGQKTPLQPNVPPAGPSVADIPLTLQSDSLPISTYPQAGALPSSASFLAQLQTPSPSTIIASNRPDNPPMSISEQPSLWGGEGTAEHEYESESECCGGIINCDGLFEEEPDSGRTAAPTSHLRSQVQQVPDGTSLPTFT